MSSTADVAVIGAGVLGASVAYHLARRGQRVVVLEKGERLGEGSTSRATGGFRSLFGSDVNLALSKLSHGKLRRFESEIGRSAGYEPVGYLFLAESESVLSEVQQTVEIAQARGVAGLQMLDVDEIRRRNPAISGDTVLGGAVDETAGFIRPMQILEGYVAAAERHGATFRYGCGDVTPRFDGSRSLGVTWDAGRLDAASTVICTGAWSRILGDRCGLEIPITPRKRQAAVTEPFDRLPPDMPMTIYLDDGFHLRVRDGHVLLLAPSPVDPSRPFDTSFDAGWLPGLVERAQSCVPCLRDAKVDEAGCWAGLYEMTPDGHLLLGAWPEVDGLFVAAGGSGHGVMHSPAAGELLASRIVDGVVEGFDIRPLRPERFGEGDPVRGSNLI